MDNNNDGFFDNGNKVNLDKGGMFTGGESNTPAQDEAGQDHNLNRNPNYGYDEQGQNSNRNLNYGYDGWEQNPNYGYGGQGQGPNMNQNYDYGNQGYPYGQQGIYQYPAQGGYEQEMEIPVTMGEWLVSMLLMLIPCVNIVLMFVWAFSDKEKKSKSNFFKANLIFAGALLVIYILLIVLSGVLLLAL